MREPINTPAQTFVCQIKGCDDIADYFRTVRLSGTIDGTAMGYTAVSQLALCNVHEETIAQMRERAAQAEPPR